MRVRANGIDVEYTLEGPGAGPVYTPQTAAMWEQRAEREGMAPIVEPTMAVKASDALNAEVVHFLASVP